ncbi:Dabb family protein [Actinomycetospora sp. CA-101289]|uniref:Dabb family protein n=1 Tax=Actinomycetospora sp. CA-101289 TaxID=3239893 RepID=UPI003D97DCA4
MSFTHVVTFAWAPDSDAARDPAVVDGIAASLREFVDGADLAGLRSWTCGRDAGLANGNGNGDFAVVAVFDDVDAYAAYRDHPEHPEHRRIIDEQIAHRVGQRSAVQFAG